MAKKKNNINFCKKNVKLIKYTLNKNKTFNFNDIKCCINNSHKMTHKIENERVDHLMNTFQFKLNKNCKKLHE